MRIAVRGRRGLSKPAPHDDERRRASDAADLIGRIIEEA
jgi:hypothetical protein